MITYFPEIYEDELLYSVFARYSIQSGAYVYRCVAEELFVNPRVRPDMEFVNELKPEVVELLCRNHSFQELILQHTMIPYYVRFLCKEKRDKALSAAYQMEGDYNNLFSVPKIKSRKKRFLRYCPICVGMDREQHGETYWHRKHQIYGMDICPEHGCVLMESSVLNSGKASPDFISAEAVVKESEIIYGNRQQQQFASYVSEGLDREIPLENDVEIGKYLNTRLSGTKYVSKRGQQRNISLLFYDFKIIFGDCREGITELWQIEKVLSGYRRNPLEIYQLAYFIGIPAEDLASPEMPEKTSEQEFDGKVANLIREGKSINGISRELQVSSRTIRIVCERLSIKSNQTKEKSLSKTKAFDKRLKAEREFWLHAIEKYPNTSYTKLCQITGYQSHLQWLRRNDKEWTDKHWPQMTAHRTKRQDWDLMDRETLPLVKEAIKKLQGINGERPKKVTFFAVNKILGFPDKRMELLPKCKAEIEKNQESQEQYWARELEWAIRKLLEEGEPVNYKHIRNLTNMRRSYIDSCYPYISDIVIIRLLEKIN